MPVDKRIALAREISQRFVEMRRYRQDERIDETAQKKWLIKPCGHCNRNDEHYCIVNNLHNSD